MIVEILCIGTELLIGDIVNTNASFISKTLSYCGFDVLYHSVCGDNKERLENTINHALSRCDILITTGGLGPTYDDITMELCAKAMGVECCLNNDVKNAIEEYFKRSGRVMTENNIKQAYIPEGAYVFMNDYGTAPGICIENNNKTIVMMPGPPREMKPMLCDKVVPYLMKYSDKVLFSSNINIFGMGESSVEEKLRHLMTESKNPTLAPYVDAGEVRLRVTGSGKTKEQARSIVEKTVNEVTVALGDVVYAVDCQAMQNKLVELLQKHSLIISTAESCTGGLLSQLITSVPGSSEVFGFGVCTYANEAKQKLIGVLDETLKNHGAVSEETAIEMAKGIQNLSGSDISLSLTGIAGPGGGTEDKPVGLVYLGVCAFGKIYAKKLLLGQHNKSDRDFIRTLAVKNAMITAIREITEFYNDRT